MKWIRYIKMLTITFPFRGTLWVLISIFALIMVNCSSIPNQQVVVKFPSKPGYLIAGQNESNQFINNKLLIFDQTSLIASRVINLPKSKIDIAEIDPIGNIWIGLSGDANKEDNHIVVYSPSGEKLAEIETCLSPNVGIHFYEKKALVVCRDTGFYASVAEVDINLYKLIQRVSVKLDGENSFTAVSSVLSGSKLVIGGLTSGPIENLSYTVLIVMEVNALSKPIGKIELGDGTNAWSIISYKENIYVLNSEGDRNPARKDILVVDMNRLKVINSVSMPSPSPLWGVCDSSSMFTFHNGGWNSIYSPVERTICKTNLDTLESICHKILDNFSGYDIGILNGQACITHWGDVQVGGLYCIENDGSLTLKISFNDASALILPNMKP